MKRKLLVLIATVSLLSFFASGCVVWKSIKDRYKPYEMTDEMKGGKRKVKFTFDSLSSKTVYLAGTFNNWAADPASVSANETKNVVINLKKDSKSGYWEIYWYLSPGKYQYKYVLDGGTWQYDQNTLEKVDDGFGGYNSIIVVK